MDIVDELDDFANDPEIQRLRKSQREYEELIAKCTERLVKEYALVSDECSNIASFYLFKSLESPEIIETFQSNHGTFRLQVFQVEYNWTSKVGRSNASGTDQCFLGLILLNKNYPSTCICKETLQIAINDWFTKHDIDFKEQKKFSRRFHVVSQDRSKLEILLNHKPLDDLAKFPEMEIELQNNHCLFRVSGNPVDIEETDKFIDLAKTIARIFN